MKAVIQDMSYDTEQLPWVILRRVNQTQAKGSTVRLIVPRNPEVVEELGRELGSVPTDRDPLSRAEYLLEHGYAVPVDSGLKKGAYTITSAGLKWIDRGLSKAPAATRGARGKQGAKKPHLTFQSC